MKKNITLLALLCIVFSLQADPIECIEPSLSGSYERFLKSNPYLIENCYYCEPATFRLIRVDKSYTEDCHYEEGSQAFYIKGEVLSNFQIKEECNSFQNFKTVNKAYDDLVIFNYIYGLNTEDRKASLLINFFSYYEWATCESYYYPSPDDIQDKEYAKWYKKFIGGTTGSQIPLPQASSDPFIGIFEGTIDNTYPITMNITFTRTKDIMGTYFYDKVKKDIQLEGTFEEGAFIINETSDGKKTGQFTGTNFSETEITGIWSNPDNSKSYPFKLSRKNTGISPWNGSRYRHGFHNWGELLIGNASFRKFDFVLEFENSCHIGFNQGTAYIEGNSAYFQETLYDNEEPCKVEFILEKDGTVSISGEGGTFNCEYGMRARPDGDYLKEEDESGTESFLPHLKSLAEKGFLTVDPEIVNQELEALFEDKTDIAYLAYHFDAYQTDKCESKDNFEADVFCTFIPGCGSSMIFMIRPNGKFYIADNGDIYISNDPKFKTKRPKTINSFLGN